MRFLKYKAIKLAQAPAEGVNPVSGSIYVWETLDGSDNLIINYRLSDGTDKTFSAGESSALSVTTLTDASNISWDLSSGIIAQVTLADNRTLSNPTNKSVGTYILKVIQDNTGSRTLAYGTDYKWAGGTAPTLTTTGNAVDIITFYCDGTSMYGAMLGDFQ